MNEPSAFMSPRQWCAASLRRWNEFWFTPSDPATLSAIRIFAGAMLFYTHFVWGLDLEAFFGPDAWVSAEHFQQVTGGGYAWTVFSSINSPTVLWAFHLFSLCVFAALTIGLFNRAAAVLAYLCALCYMHRALGANFGLDQINIMLALYLMIGPSGARYSVDAWLRRRRARQGSSRRSLLPVLPSVSGNIAIRLIQIHMCVIYFFAGTRKLMGDTWWDGSAMWYSMANYEYQTLDLTWLIASPALISLITHLTIFWEVSYAFLVWPRLSRPAVLFFAIVTHLGIAVCLGMATFGLAMLVANLAFIHPQQIQWLVAKLHRRDSTALSPTA